MMRILAWFLIGLGVGALIAQAFLVTGWPLVLLGIAGIVAGVALLMLPGVRKHTVPVSSTPAVNRDDADAPRRRAVPWWLKLVAAVVGLAVVLIPNYNNVAGGASLYVQSLQDQHDDRLLTDEHAIEEAFQALHKAADSDRFYSFRVEADRIQMGVPNQDEQGRARELEYRLPGTLGASGVRDTGSAFVLDEPGKVRFDEVSAQRITQLYRQATDHLMEAGYPQVAEAESPRLVLNSFKASDGPQYEMQFRPQLMGVTFDADGTIVRTSPAADDQERSAQSFFQDEEGLRQAVAELEELVGEQPVANLTVNPRRISVAVAIDDAKRMKMYEWAPPRIHGNLGAHASQVVNVEVAEPDQMFTLAEVPWEKFGALAEDMLTGAGLDPDGEEAGRLSLMMRHRTDHPGQRIDVSTWVSEQGSVSVTYDLDGNVISND
ncbi:hypothetical protein [Micrococcoides hystricis]|uniref:Uncharacterized protein n=1 Tax=Micrococcoides hystricis TaxID=1572761 RepID=A0ABV6PBD8_9MICC